jgi:hypothetical protein
MDSSNSNTNVKKERTVEQGTGVVKAVPSGDTLIIVQLSRSASSGPPPEREISLSGVRGTRVM